MWSMISRPQRGLGQGLSEGVRRLLPKSTPLPTGPSITGIAHYDVAPTISTLFVSTHTPLLAPFADGDTEVERNKVTCQGYVTVK